MQQWSNSKNILSIQMKGKVREEEGRKESRVKDTYIKKGQAEDVIKSWTEKWHVKKKLRLSFV